MQHTLPLRSPAAKIASELFAIVKIIINPSACADLTVMETVNGSFSANTISSSV